MKTRNLIIYATAFLILISSCYALCKGPDLTKQRQCLAKCETGLVMQASCSDACNKEMNDYIKCTEDEQKEREFKAEKGGTAKVTGIRGKLKITRKDGTVETVTSDAVIRYGDTIETQAGNGYATITLQDGTSFKISPGGKLRFDADIEKKCSGSTLGLYLARLKVMVKHINAGKRAQWEVRTPQACCCIRGTDFIVDYDDVKEVTKVYLYDGELDVISIKDETFELNAGEMMTLDSNGNVDKASLSEDEWNSVAESIEPEEDIIPIQATQATSPEEQKTSTSTYLIAAGIVLLILLSVLITKKFRKK